MAGPFFSVFIILSGFLCCTLTSLAFGLAAVRWLRLELTRGESIAIGYLLGSAINSTVTLALGLSGAIGQPVFVAVALIALIILSRQRSWFAALPRASGASIPGAVQLLLLVAFVFYGVIYFRQALSPEVSPDGAEYHLGLVNLWTHAGRIYRIADTYAAFPQAIEMLFLFAFEIGRHSAAALVHLSFLLDLPILMLLYGRRFGWSYFATGFAAVLVFASPTFGSSGTSAYNDLALAATCFGAVYLLQMWRLDRNWRFLIACGLLTGFAGAIKYSAFPLGAVVAAAIAWELRKSGSATAVRAMAGALLAAGVVCGPYLVRNWIWFDNPVSSFANRIFYNPWFHVSTERAYVSQMANYGGISWRDIAVGLTLGNGILPDRYGAVFLLIPIGLAGLCWRQSRLIVLTGSALAAVYIGNKDPRFLIPALVFMAMGLGFVVARARRGSALLVTAATIHLMLSWPAFMDYADYRPLYQWRLHPISWRDALRITPEAEYLSRLPGYAMARRIEALVPEGEPVLTLTGGVMQSYTTHRIVVSWRSAYGDRMADLLLGSWHSPEDRRRRFSFTLPSSGVRRIRVLQDGRDATAMWNVDEVQFLSGGKVVPISPDWKLSAWPNPWDAGLAFDHNLATRWRSWESLRPGMHIDVDFGPGPGADTVAVVLDNREWTTRGEGVWPAQVSLEVVTDAGKTTRVLPRITVDPPADLRRDAEEALKHGGIHYLLINDGDWQQGQFRWRPENWNMHAVANGPQATLFRLD